MVQNSFVTQREHSWQAHLERISPFLVNERRWWAETPNSYEFMDGDKDPDYQPSGPKFLHFSTSTIEDVEKRQKKSWKQIADKNVSLPAHCICLYNDEGDLADRVVFTTNETITTERASTTTLTEFSDSGNGEGITTTTTTTLTTSMSTLESNSTKSSDTEEHQFQEETILGEYAELVDEASTADREAENPVHELQTKLCKTIQKATGISDDLKTVDHIRHTIKTQTRNEKTPSRNKVIRHERLKEKLHGQISTHAQELKKQITAYENQFFSIRNTIPDMDTNEDYRELVKKRNYSKWLLSTWKSL